MSGSVNLFSIATEGDPGDPAGFRSRMGRFGQAIGAEQLGASVYELDPGESICPYHYEFPEEEWLLVLEGNPTLRDPDGEHVLDPGDLVVFVEGPEGAHKVSNGADQSGVARVMLLSTKSNTAVCVYPDSNKVGVWPLGKLFRLDDAVDYYDGELNI